MTEEKPDYTLMDALRASAGLKAEPRAESDPLEEALALAEALKLRSSWEDALAAIRVLKRGHTPDALRHLCHCGQDWPCPQVAEAAEALRGVSR